MKPNQKFADKFRSKTIKLSKYLIYVLLILLVISVYKNISKINQIYKRITEKEEDVKKLEEANKDLEEKVQESSNPDYIEKQIRDKLGLAKEGEIVVVLPPPEVLRKYAPVVEREEENLPDPNWKKWLHLFYFK
jgi:cell division protein FtsB